MRFWEALEKCYNGAKITCTDWNGKNAYVYYTRGSMVNIENWHGPDKPSYNEVNEGYITIMGHFDMMTARGYRVIGWLASQSDMTSANWEVVE